MDLWSLMEEKFLVRSLRSFFGDSLSLDDVNSERQKKGRN